MRGAKKVRLSCHVLAAQWVAATAGRLVRAAQWVAKSGPMGCLFKFKGFTDSYSNSRAPPIVFHFCPRLQKEMSCRWLLLGSSSADDLMVELTNQETVIHNLQCFA